MSTSDVIKVLFRNNAKSQELLEENIFDEVVEL